MSELQYLQVGLLIWQMVVQEASAGTNPGPVRANNGFGFPGGGKEEGNDNCFPTSDLR